MYWVSKIFMVAVKATEICVLKYVPSFHVMCLLFTDSYVIIDQPFHSAFCDNFSLKIYHFQCQTHTNCHWPLMCIIIEVKFIHFPFEYKISMQFTVYRYMQYWQRYSDLAVCIIESASQINKYRYMSLYGSKLPMALYGFVPKLNPWHWKC